MKTISFWISALFFFVSDKSISARVGQLHTIYYQLGTNMPSRQVQKQSDCVIARFSIMKPNNSLGFSFQGYQNETKKVLSYEGQLTPFSRDQNLYDGMYCSTMKKADNRGVVLTNETSDPTKLLCLWKYEPVRMDWIIFTDYRQTLFFALLSNRSSSLQYQSLDFYIQQWEDTKQSQIYRYSLDQMVCNQFTPT